MQARARVLELESDLETTQQLFKLARSKRSKQAINKLRWLMIKEKNLLINHGKDDWRDL